VAAAIRDTTVRKQGEAALRQSEERFAKAFQTSPAALTITRAADNLYIDVNESFLSIFGYDREEIIAKKSTTISINTDPVQRAEIVRQFHEHGSVNNYESVLQTKSGEFRNMLMSVDNLLLDDEAYFLTTMLDITDRKQYRGGLAAKRRTFR